MMLYHLQCVDLREGKYSIRNLASITGPVLRSIVQSKCSFDLLDVSLIDSIWPYCKKYELRISKREGGVYYIMRSLAKEKKKRKREEKSCL